MTSPDILVVGAGLWGCTIARVLAENGRKVLVLEKRPVPGGNVRCEIDAASGIEIHQYGAHIFHTHLDNVWDFVQRFISFNGYQHKVLARYDNKTFFLPLGLTLVNQFYGLNLSPEELPGFIKKEAAKAALPPGVEPRNFEEQAIAFIGEPLYRAFIREYTQKQWGMDPINLDASIIKRLPVRANYDVNYYNDYRQGIPLSGYNSLFERMLTHPNIEVVCNVDWVERRLEFPQNIQTFYSGPIDRLFGFKFGPLPWRSLRFEQDRLPIADFQGTSVMNYTGADVPYTRILEFKHFHPENKAVMVHGETIICREFSRTWHEGDEPYYPVNTKQSRELLALYNAEAAKIPNLVVGGRLGEYKYYDMDQAIGSGLDTTARFL